MSIERFAPENTAQILEGLAAQAGVSIATQWVLDLFEKWSGKRYSESDFGRYIDLKRIYAQTLHRECPPFWELDEQKRPTHRVLKQRWPEYAKGLHEGKCHSGSYYSQVVPIVEHITTYLAERERRWFGGGEPGDLLSLFFAEMLHFAINELPTYRYDETSITMIKLRLQYLVRVQKHETLFKVGRIKRNKSKYEVMESIKQELIECERLAKEEALRECARDKLQFCCHSTVQLLLAAVQVLYYGRATPIYHEALNLRGYLNLADNSYLTKNARKIYPKLQKTHTGELLQEVLNLAGLDAFGKQAVSGTGQPFVSRYFNQDFSLKKVDYDIEKYDLPEWYQGKPTEALTYFAGAHTFAQSILRIAKLKRLVQEVYVLTGKLGDLWAYGDRRGKLSLEGLLFLFENELELFQTRFEKFYLGQDQLRLDYVRENRVNLAKDVNRNFNKLDEQKELLDKIYAPIKQVIADLKLKIMAFSEEEVKRVDARKENLYQDIADYIHHYYPKAFDRFKGLREPLTYDEAVAAFGLDQPFWGQDKFFKDTALDRLGQEDFSRWRKNYFLRHPTDLANLGILLLQLDRKLYQKGSMEVIEAMTRQLEIHLTAMRNTAEAEQPKWRFGWFYISLGWPFQRSKFKNIQLLLRELDCLKDDVRCAVEEERERRRVNQPSPAMNDGLKQYFAPQVQQEVTAGYQVNRSTIFKRIEKSEPLAVAPSQGGRDRFASRFALV